MCPRAFFSYPLSCCQANTAGAPTDSLSKKQLLHSIPLRYVQDKTKASSPIGLSHCHHSYNYLANHSRSARHRLTSRETSYRQYSAENCPQLSIYNLVYSVLPTSWLKSPSQASWGGDSFLLIIEQRLTSIKGVQWKIYPWSTMWLSSVLFLAPSCLVFH